MCGSFLLEGSAHTLICIINVVNVINIVKSFAKCELHIAECLVVKHRNTFARPCPTLVPSCISISPSKLSKPNLNLT